MRFGESVQVEYVEMADEEGRARYPELAAAAAADRDLPYPLVTVDNQLRLAGTAHYYNVLPLVEEALEAETVA